MKTIVRMDPFREMHQMGEMFDRMFGPWPTDHNSELVMPVDVLERGGKFIVRATIPGVLPEDLKVSIQDNVLTIKGEHREDKMTEDAKVYHRESRYGSFTRSVRLPDNCNLDMVEAIHENGVITVQMPLNEEVKKKCLDVPVQSKSLEMAPRD